MSLESIDAGPTAEDAVAPQRYVVLKTSGSRYAYVNDTLERRTITRWDILRGDGWAKAEAQCARLNAADLAGQVTP
jgi:hypothetical protein